MNSILKGAAIALTALMTAAVASPASATGSDAPTPYTVDTAGVTLPGDETFKANGHVNIKYLSEGQEKSKGIHFDPNNNQPGGKWIGRNFIPWSAFGDDIQCVTWVQVHGYNQHFGEGGQKPVCLQKPPTEPPSDKEVDYRTVDGVPNCEERVVPWVKEKRSRVAVFDWDWKKYEWVQTGWKPWSDWKQVDSGFRNEKGDGCDDIPSVGSEMSLGLMGAAALALLSGGALLMRRRAA